jgi:hypothetical protein
MNSNFGKKPRKATFVKEEKTEASVEVSKTVEKNKLSLEKKMEVCREILNFKEIVSNSVIADLVQSQYFAGQDQQSKLNFKQNLEYSISKHFDNLLERVQKKL